MSLLCLRCLSGQAGRNKALRLFEISNQLDRAFALAAHSQPDVYLAGFIRRGLNTGHLDAGRKDTLQIHHHRGPAKAFLRERGVQKLASLKDRHILRLPHP